MPFIEKITLPNISKEYRPELNGLRALAVLLVLFFHLDFEWMKGGFLGVDVFLVISGYFISKNIIYEMQQGKFTFYRFYTKRLRRLFPALIFTLTLVLVVGYFMLTPSNYERLGKSTIYSSLSLSNFFFWSEAGYFNLDSGLKPLLHMWSLSLEEQFYLFWPLLLFLLYRYFKKYIILFILLFIIGSISLSEWYFSTDQSAVFFLIPFRMFEFLLGASCIWLERFFNKKPAFLLESLFFIGLLSIIYSAVVFSSLTQMPGLLSLIPCLGAVLIIIGGKAPILSWTLKNKLVELIGKSSYSIYLVHWPLIIYYQYWALSDMSLITKVVLGLGSIFLGILMWHFIENTFRYAKNKNVKLDKVWAAIPTSLLLLCFLSANIWGSNGVPSRFTGELYMTKEEILENRELYFDEYREKGALLRGKSNKGHVMIMGNSHSIDLIFALRQNGFESKITALKSLGDCYNFGESYFENYKKLCTTFKEKNLADKNWQNVDAIYLHDNWPKWDVEGFRRIIKRIQEISNSPIFVFGPKMTYLRHIPEIVRSSNSIKPKVINNYAMQFARKGDKFRINESLKAEFMNPDYKENNVYYIDVLSFQGGEHMDSFDIVSKENLNFLYFDNSHFTKQGSKELGEKIKATHPYLFDIKTMQDNID